jgi:hypothetical protein
MAFPIRMITVLTHQIVQNYNFGRKNCSQRNLCKGDFDCDGDVDDDDYLILKENLGKTGCAACEFICNYE